VDVETVLRQTQSPSAKKRLFSTGNSKMKPELCLVPSDASSQKKDVADLHQKKSLSRKERLLALAQKIAQQNAEITNEMFEIMKLED
jgi:hypothetical protein